ncbi:MAG: alpha/beta hydrolase [Chloroflexi bacterium]|nr:alpha/beta hydrolase [Chloroflexota bacterium]
MPVAVVGDLRFSYREAGSPDGALIVLAHGALSDKSTWSLQEPSLAAAGFRAVSLDRRGHGETAASLDPTQHTIETDAADLLALLDVLQSPPAVLAGHSYGGTVVLEAARQAPERVRALVLLEPTILDLLARHEAGAALVAGWRVAADETMIRYRAGGDDEALDYFLSHSLSPNWRQMLRPQVQEVLRRNVPALPAQLAALLRYRLSPDDLAAIHVPTLLVRGVASGDDDRLTSDLLARHLPQTDEVTIPDAGHAMHGQNPTAFNAALLAYLERFKQA